MSEAGNRDDASAEEDEEAGTTSFDAAAAERLIFFSDAVVAIAITLLAFTLPIPKGNTTAEVLHAVGGYKNQYLAFLISFFVIGSYWRFHQRLFRSIPRLDSRVTAANMIWLLAVAITPYATRVLSQNGAFGLRFTFYAAIQFLTLLCFFVMNRDLRRAGLLPDVAESQVREVRILTVAALFLISIPLAFVTQWAYLAWIAAAPATRLTVPLYERKSQPDDAPAPPAVAPD